ncbi:protease pro-enzyme activation domain-containing protein [Streptomyces sp. NPDC006879]|uniref:S53 family peptidase n=1 Tax=Streptomyces sp. NPDC006879 TaxID=3364767 RepID=UPI0036900276
MGRHARVDKQGRGRAGVAVTAALALGVGIAPAALAETAPSPSPQRVGEAPRVPKGAVRAAEPADGQALELSVVLQPRDGAGLKRFIAEVSDPASPHYKQYLKTGEFAGRFGADPKTVAKVRGELREEGLTVGELGPDGLSLSVRTTIGKAAKAFRTEFDGYRLADGRAGVTNTRAPLLGGDIAPSVRAVVGLNTLATYEPRHTGSRKVALSKARTERAKAAEAPTTGTTGVAGRLTGKTPATCSWLTDDLAGSGLKDTRDYWTPRSLATAYGMVDQSNVQTGTTVGVFALEGFRAADMAEYQACHGTKVPISTVKVHGGPTITPRGGYGLETALDVQTIIGLAPQAKVVVYQGPDAQNATWAQGVDVYRKMVNDNRVKVISTSWGSCELNTPREVMDAENLIFQQAAAQGQTVTAASGDSGSNGCYFGDLDTPNAKELSTDDPASQPYVLAVGGTRMTGAGGTSESVWNNDSGAGGGGVSQHFTLDAATGYQAQVKGTGYDGRCEASAGRACRQVPDVAGLGDPDTGYLVSYDDSWYFMGGTSGASPLWAALIAQANQSLACAANGPVGFAHPALYRLPSSAFRDVTRGDNAFAPAGGGHSLFQAGAGYDLATGLGSPQGRQIISGLCKAVPRSGAATFHPLAPKRILDTRYGIGRSGTKAVAGKTAVRLKVTGAGGVPSTGVTSVVMNVTVASATGAGHLTAYPSGTTRPDSSNLNWLKNEIVPNLVTVPVGKNGSVEMFSWSNGTVHIIADVSGYFSNEAGGATFNPTGPSRILDTRAAIGRSSKSPVAGRSLIKMKVAGAGGVPSSGARAVVLNVTATAPKSGGHLIAYPGRTSRPTASNINWSAGQTRPNQVVLPIGSDGTVNLYNAGYGSVHFVADVFGYYADSANGSSFRTAGPSRLLDTRYALGTSGARPLKGGTKLALNLDDGHSLSKAKAVVLNVTITQPSSGGFLTVWPDGRSLPNASNLNWVKGQTVANLVTVPVINGKVAFRANAGQVHVIADLFGYYE